MTVLEFYNQYRQMNVDLVTGTRVFNVDVHEYRNAQDYFQGTSALSDDFDVDAGMDIAWAQLRAKIRKAGKKLGTNKYELTFSYIDPSELVCKPVPLDTASLFSKPIPAGATPRFITETVDVTELAPVFFGKGSPQVIRRALRLAAGLGTVVATSSAMNTYATNYIGLDCSGFVGNYLKQEGLSELGPSTKSTQFAPAASRIDDLNKIKAQSVLVWKNTNHVAIVNSVDQICRVDGTVHAMVAESSGARLEAGNIHTDGLNYTEYIFKSVDAKSKVFKVQRGIGTSTKPSEVYVANFN